MKSETPTTQTTLDEDRLDEDWLVNTQPWFGRGIDLGIAKERERCARIVRSHLGHVTEGSICAEKMLREIENAD